MGHGYKRLEEMTLNTWPALETIVRDGWLVRCAGGYTKRANSVSSLYGAAEETMAAMEQRVRCCERDYMDRGLAPAFKLTPFSPAALDRLLEQLGYDTVEPSQVMLLDMEQLSGTPVHATVQCRQAYESDWLDAYARLSGMTARSRSVAEELLRRTGARRFFFSLDVEHATVACGLGVIQDDTLLLYDIVTDAACRRRGYGEQLVQAMLRRGQEEGAVRCALQVVQANEAANRLYAKLGFRTIYDYWYRVKTNA